MTSLHFTDIDTNLITFALRKLANNTSFENIKSESEHLIQYIEDAAKKQKETNQQETEY